MVIVAPDMGICSDDFSRSFAEPKTTEVVTTRLRQGDACPVCGEGRMDYDGLLNLVCERCGVQGPGCGGSFS